MSPDPIDDAEVDVEPAAPPRPPFAPIYLLTSTGVSYFKREKPYCAAVVLACWN